MEECPDAESLNNEVFIPFAAALEAVCGARGYVLNIYGETSNIIFTGDPDDAEEIFRFTESYLASRDESVSWLQSSVIGPSPATVGTPE